MCTGAPLESNSRCGLRPARPVGHVDNERGRRDMRATVFACPEHDGGDQHRAGCTHAFFPSLRVTMART